MKVRLTLTLTAFLVAAFSGAHAAADTSAKLKAAIADERRGSVDMARDANRKPLQTLEFFGLKDDMTVLELVPGGGWYTKILAPVLAESEVQAIGTDETWCCTFRHNFLARANGAIVLSLDSPTFRAFWWGTQRLLVNGIFFGDLLREPR